MSGSPASLQYEDSDEYHEEDEFLLHRDDSLPDLVLSTQPSTAAAAWEPPADLEAEYFTPSDQETDTSIPGEKWTREMMKLCATEYWNKFAR